MRKCRTKRLRILGFVLLMLFGMTACTSSSEQAVASAADQNAAAANGTDTVEDLPEEPAVMESESEAADAVVITVGTLEEREELDSLVSKFNAASEGYTAQLALYDSATELNARILTGEGPDVVYLSSSFPYLHYIQRDIFLDLSDVLEEAQEYEPTIREMLSTQFDNQVLLATYSLDCIAAPEYVLEGRTTWTFEEFMEIAASTNTFEKFTKDVALTLYCTANLGEFIDTSQNTCSFESEEFYAALEFCNRFLTDRSQMTSDGVAADIQLTTGIPTLLELDMEFYDLMFWGGSPSTYIGFPSDSGAGIMIEPNLMFAVPYSTSNETGAKAFLVYTLSEEFQEDQAALNYFSVLQDVLRNRVTELFSTNEYAEEPIAAEMTAKLEDVLARTTAITYLDVNIFEIVTDEAASYFSGDKSVEEAAHLIQSRVQLYLDEQA